MKDELRLRERKGSDVETVLRKRAQALSRPLAEVETGKRLSLVAYNIGEENYAVDVRYVREIRALENLTTVPCTPDFVAGVVNLRGSLLSVIDIRKFLPIAHGGITDLTRIVIITADPFEVGLLAESVSGIRDVSLGGIHPSGEFRQTASQKHILGVTDDLLTVLDVKSLLRDPRMVVKEEIE
jgi:purine-binding chemotaxis protein CheW